MTSPRCAPEPPSGSLQPRRTRDGSFSLWSEAFCEGFHSADGALAEARSKFVEPAELERFHRGRTLTVVEVAVGTGTNTAALLEAVEDAGLELRWWGLERDRRPLALALADPGFHRQWAQGVPARLAALTGSRSGALDPTEGEDPGAALQPVPLGGMLWGDARRRLPELLEVAAGRCDLVLLDAFSPRRCPQLWTLEFLAGLGRLLNPEGRLLTYSSAAAVRRALALGGLELAGIRAGSADRCSEGSAAGVWSGGTAASPTPLPCSALLRELGAMEREHLASRAGEPYRDPTGTAPAAEILAAREQAQQRSGAESASAWRRRWGLERSRR